MSKKYYIGDNIATVNEQDIANGVRILCSKKYHYLKFKDIEGPFDSINQLKKRSQIFKKLAANNPKRTQQILTKSNFFVIDNLVLRPANADVPIEFVKVFQHATKGDIKSKKLYGIHFFNPRKMKVKEIIFGPDKNEVWKAKIEIVNDSLVLEKTSTFFPKNWSVSQLFDECEYAFNNRIKIEGTSNKYKSSTISGVPVEIIIQNSKPKSIYPILAN